MGRFCINEVDCEYKECDRRLMEQFINGLDDEVILEEIIQELTALKDNSEVSSDEVLMWAKKVEAQRAQMKVLDNLIDKRSLSLLEQTSRSMLILGRIRNLIETCKYCGTGHLQRQCPTNGMTCSGCNKANHFKAVYKTIQRQQQGH